MSKGLLALTLAFVAAIVLLADAHRDRSITDLKVRLHAPAMDEPARIDSVAVQPTRAQPVPIDRRLGQSVTLEVATRGWLLTGVATVGGRGGEVWLATASGSKRIPLGPQRNNCKSEPDGSWRCRHLWKTSHLDREELILYPVADTAELVEAGVELAVAHRASMATFNGIVLLIGSLLVFGPLFVWLRARSPKFELLLGASATIIWLSISGWLGVAIVLLALALGFAICRLAVRTPESWWLTLGPVFAIALVFLVLVKSILPEALAPLAERGGFILALPIGLSFLAVRLIDIVVAIRAGAATEISLSDYLGFLLYPPAFAAGPLAGWSEFRQTAISDWSIVAYAQGVARCGVGLAKKLASDTYVLPLMTAQYDAFLVDPGGARALLLATLLLANLIYFYLDLSAYSDMAIGAARAMGRRLPENFDWPLLSTSLQRFWQSWHMSLASWAMRRVYFPVFLGSRSRFLSLLAAMLVIGLWHQTSMGWQLWALHHALGLWLVSVMPERPVLSLPLLDRCAQLAYAALGWVGTLSWVCLGFIFTLFDSWALRFAALATLVRF